MPIPESTLSRWSHHQAATAFKQAHLPIRKAMEEHRGLSQFTYEPLCVRLTSSKSATLHKRNLGGVPFGVAM